MNRAVFLDRDGVINRNVFYGDTGEYESPRAPDDFEFHANVIKALRSMEATGYKLFVVSNQPNVAKGKSTLKQLDELHAKMEKVLQESGVHFTAFYYCYHHPDSAIAPFGGHCDCRKPSPYFLHRAEKEHQIDLSHSWMVGDRASDIACGVAAGVRTIRLLPDHPSNKDIQAEAPAPAYYAKNLAEAAKLILHAS